MKYLARRYNYLFVAMLVATSVANRSASAEVIAFFDFNDGFAVADDSVQIIHIASAGNGTLYQQRAQTDGNGKSGVAFADPSQGINAIDGRSMAWDDVANTGANDAEFFVQVSTLGFTDIRIRFDIEGNDPPDLGIVSYDFKYALSALEDVTNPPDVVGTIKDFAGGNSISVLNNQALSTNGTTFVSQTINLSGIAVLNNQSVVAFRFDDFQENDGMSIDNVLITGTPIGVSGDANGDGNFDFGDIEAFFLALTDATAYATQYPDVAISLLDMNADGNTDFGDIDAFFTALTGG